jgi:hypothetical protein
MSRKMVETEEGRAQSQKGRIAPVHVDETPTPGPEKTGLQNAVSAEDPALRVLIGEYTIDVLPIQKNGRILTLVSNGELGTPPAMGVLPPSTISLLLTAGHIRERRVIDTAGWALPEVTLRAPEA